MTDKQHKQEPQLRPEYIAKLQKIKKEKGIHFKSVGELKKYIKK